MSDPTPPAVSDAIREAVARWILKRFAVSQFRARADAKSLLELGPIASEIARLTGLNAELQGLLATADICHDRLKARAETAEAETARLRAALEAEMSRRRKMDVFGIAIHAIETGLSNIRPDVRDNIARSISSQVRAALTSQEQDDV